MSLEQPNSISFKDHIFDFSFHPSRNVIAVGLITGQIQCFEYSIEKENTLQWTKKISKKSCRGVEFTQDGAHLMCISRDKSIQTIDVATGRILYKIPKAHKYAINKICKLDTHLTATGDDEGYIKVWDMRTCKSTQEYKVHEDYISDMTFCDSKSSLLTAGGDGTISVFDMRKPVDKIHVSNELDDELLCIKVIENHSKVIAGAQSGALYTWEWNKWDQQRKWLGHPNSIDTLCKLDEEVICTGSSDGLIRLISIQPYKFEGILGDHGEDFPIECIKMDHQQTYLASCGHDLQLKFWNIQFLFDSQHEIIDLEEDSNKESKESFFKNL